MVTVDNGWSSSVEDTLTITIIEEEEDICLCLPLAPRATN